jgi:hydrogenase expression/formation protein HypE
MDILPAGKLPPVLFDQIISKIPKNDPSVIIGPGTGMDSSIIDLGSQYLVVKSDPISLTSKNIGWHAVQINVNDIMTSGGDPHWMMTTLLLPENQTTFELVNEISDNILDAAQEYGISIIGGHTEITNGIERPILAATMIGTVEKSKLISPYGVKSGDLVFLTKEICIETVAILANDFSEHLEKYLSEEELKISQGYLKDPGISVYKEARLIRDGFGVTAMHDPTEGGIAAALWELSISSNKILLIDLDQIALSPLSAKICSIFDINPINSISSGALLFTADPLYEGKIINILKDNQIAVRVIGSVGQDGTGVIQKGTEPKKFIQRPVRDEITKVFYL